MAELLTKYVADEQMIARILDFTQRRSEQETDKATYQAMEALIHNLNTMNSRAGRLLSVWILPAQWAALMNSVRKRSAWP